MIIFHIDKYALVNNFVVVENDFSSRHFKKIRLSLQKTIEKTEVKVL